MRQKMLRRSNKDKIFIYESDYKIIARYNRRRVHMLLQETRR